MKCHMAVSNLREMQDAALIERNLREETADALNRASWPVGEIYKLEPAGESPFGRDTVLFVTPGGIAMTALLERDPSHGTNGQAYLYDIWEGWDV